MGPIATSINAWPVDNNPMPTLVEWQVLPGERRLEPEQIAEANKGVRLSTIADPDGNTITFHRRFPSPILS